MANTKMYFLKTMLDKEYKHTLYFNSKAAQTKFFLNKQIPGMMYSDFTFQRKDEPVRVPLNADKMLAAGINYCMYTNPEYSNKWFYAFVTKIDFVDDGRCDVHITTDCMQTWMFDIVIGKSFIEREHTISDEIGEHTIEEGLELGEYICNKHTLAGYTSDDLNVVIAVTKDPEKDENVRGLLYAGIYSGIAYRGFDSDDISAINEYIAKFPEDGAADAITCMFMAPRRLAPYNSSTHHIQGNNWVNSYYINPISPNQTDIYTNISFSSGDIDGYTPDNKKLLCYPFRYLLVSNNSGVSSPLKYERFFTVDGSGNKTNIEPRFVIEGALCPGCSIRMVPLNYNGAPRNDEEGFNMGKFPILNWTSDVYTNWLTQNGVNIALQVVSGVGQIAAGVAMAASTGGVGLAVGGSSIAGGVSTITNTIAQVHTQSFTPPQSRGNINSGDVVTASDQNDFHFYDMTIKAEFAKIIDEYFNMFGYKCNRVKVPYKNHRKKYWYTKTIDANINVVLDPNISAGVPQDDLQTIKDCYNKGITFWRNESNFEDYGGKNEIYSE